MTRGNAERQAALFRRSSLPSSVYCPGRYFNKRARAIPALLLSSESEIVPSLSESAALKRASMMVKYSAVSSVPSLSTSALAKAILPTPLGAISFMSIVPSRCLPDIHNICALQHLLSGPTGAEVHLTLASRP